MKRSILAPVLIAIIFSISTLIAGHHEKKAKTDIVDTAVNVGSFETLVAAVKAAGLVETLKGDGPFTVFAPTDDAFAKLPEGTVENLLKPENKEQLVAILTYHVVAGKVTADLVVNIDRANTVNGQAVRVAVKDKNVFINDAKVVKTDIMTSNGVIHVIDRVLIPGETEAPETSAIGLIEKAIERGVPLYNNGQPAACAAVYEIATRALIGLSSDLPPMATQHLTAALSKSQKMANNSDKAWILRHGLDAAYTALRQDTMTRL